MARRSNEVRHVSDFPTWYSLDKYKGAAGLDAAGWYEQLAVRRDTLLMIDLSRQQHWQTDGPSNIGAQEMQVLALIRETPIVDLRSDTLLMAYLFGGAMYELKNRDPRDICYALGVHLATVRNLYLTEGHIEKEKRDYARNFFSQIFDKDDDWRKPWKYKCVDWIDAPVDAITNSTVNVRVNLSLPDKVLIDQFKLFLKGRRSHLQRLGTTIENRQKPDFAGWQRFGVLPYLDLQIWERESGMNIPNRVMADAIFPQGEGGEEVVRKTTAKLADELLTRKHLETLVALAAHEIAENPKPEKS